MALPVAQLGYMPNLGSPGRGPTTVVEDPWSQLAMQVLGAVVQKGIGNAFEQDYTSQAQREGLPVDPAAKDNPWYKRILTGARTDEGQLNQLRGEFEQGKRAKTAEKGQTIRHGETLAKTTSEGALNREQTADLFKLKEYNDSLAADVLTKERMANNAADNLARITDRNLQTQAAQSREDAGNKTAIDVANINAGSPQNIARMVQAYQALMSGGRTDALISGTTPPTTVSPETLAAIEVFMKKFPQLQQPR